MPTLKYTPEQMNKIVINPKTNRKVKFGSIVSKYGNIVKKYSNDLFIGPNDKVLRRDVIAVNQATNEVIKIDFNAETLAEPFSQINPKTIAIGNTINNFDIMASVPTDRSVEIAFTLEFQYSPSTTPDKPVPINETVTGLFTPEELSDENFLRNYIVSNFNIPPDMSSSDMGYNNIRVFNILTKNKRTLTLDKMTLREQTPLDLINLFNEDIPLQNGNCIHSYMEDKYPKHATSIQKLHNVDDIYNWSVTYRVKMIAYDINHNIIKSHYPEKKQKMKNLIFVAYNNHMYPIKNPTLHKHIPIKSVVKIVDNIQTSFLELLRSGCVPFNVMLSKTTISNFSVIEIIDNIKTEIIFSDNKDYNKCRDILDKFGQLDKLTPGTTLKTIGSILEDLYCYKTSKDGRRLKINTSSFIPVGSKLTKAGYQYKNEKFEESMSGRLVTTDVNNAFANELQKLDKLPIIDMKIDRPEKITHKHHRINPDYKYIVSVENRNILLENNGEFYGRELLIARSKNIKFKLLEELPVRYVENYFKKMIPDLKEKLEKDDFKQIINILIGKMEYKTEIYNKFSYSKIMNEDECKTFDGYISKFSLDEYSIGYTKKEEYYVNSRKPIADMIKDQLRIRLFYYIEKHKLKKNQIKQIRTDSITFEPFNESYLDDIGTKLGKWKIEPSSKFRELSTPIISPKDIPSFFYDTTGDNILITGYAGCGKTYDIINNIIPLLKESYIVLTPSHTSLEEYRLAGYNCDVIQKYSMNNNLPDEHHIIVDEIGMVGNSSWNMLYKCKLSGKQLICYGDFNQLAPVSIDNKTFDNPNFLNMMFKIQKKNNNNHRNNFTHEYYDTLRKNAMKLRDTELKKYNTPYETADIIIAFRRSIRDEYNKRMCEKNNIENLWDIGAKVICKTNDLRRYDIYNNFRFTVKNIDDEDITLISNQSVEYILPVKKFKKQFNFDYAYALTLYAVQGSSLGSFHYCEEDLKYLNGRSLYTLISRLKK